MVMVTLASGDVDTSGRLRILKLVDARYEMPIIKGEKGVRLHLQKNL